MIKEKLYLYTGDNGTILSPIHLPNVPAINKVRLIADFGKMLTADGKTFLQNVVVFEENVAIWKEVEGQK